MLIVCLVLSCNVYLIHTKKKNRGQRTFTSLHCLLTTANCTGTQLVSSVSRSASGSDWEGSFNACTAASGWDRLGLAGWQANFSRYLCNTIHRHHHFKIIFIHNIHYLFPKILMHYMYILHIRVVHTYCTYILHTVGYI